MTGKNIDNSKTVLVAPLNWGLGHATRCIPLIRELLAQNIQVMMAGDGAVAALLTKEFPQLTLLPLKSFAIKYAPGNKGLIWKILGQLPGALLSVYRERKWLKTIIRKYKVDAVIADNRMGLYHPGIHCIYITHQLHIKTGLGNMADNIAQRLHYHFINRFNECWVPDYEGEQNLAGELSHPVQKPAVPVKYIGALSRFEKLSIVEKEYDYLVILSGPEPQRTMFENKLLQQIPSVEGKFLLVRGLPESSSAINSLPNASIINHLTADELNVAIQSASLIISRTGYTTIMDMIKLQQKAILVPTPGQPEQEYLAQHLSADYFYTTTQEDFDLRKAINAVQNFSSTASPFTMNLYRAVIKDFISRLTNNNLRKVK